MSKLRTRRLGRLDLLALTPGSAPDGQGSRFGHDLRLQVLAGAFAVTIAVWLGFSSAALAAEPCPNEAIRVQQIATALPECRAYEQVSPVEKNGYDAPTNALGGNIYYAQSTASGDAFDFETFGPFGDARQGAKNGFLASRTGSDWSSHAFTPIVNAELFGSGPYQQALSSDGSRVLYLQSNSPLVSDGPRQEQAGIYLVDTGSGAINWISRPTIANPVEPHRVQAVGVTPDLSKVFFVAEPENAETETVKLVPSDEAKTAGPGLYEWDEGTLRAVGILPDGEVGNGSSYARARQDSPMPVVANNEISSDGSHVFFASPFQNKNFDPEPELYVRIGGSRTELVSRSAITGQEAPHEAMFKYASPDGSEVWFTSLDQLTADAPATGTSTYEFDVATEELTYAPHGAPIDSSTDGSVYIFNQPGTEELWLDQEGELTHIADHAELSFFQAEFSITRAMPDGSRFAFVTADPVSGGFNNLAGVPELYVYDVASRQLSCASCPPAGEPELGEVGFGRAGRPEVPGIVVASRGWSSNGEDLFFDTANALVPADRNGIRDAYEWRGGEIYLLSRGAGATPSTLLDNSTSGEDAFISTRDRLASTDTDNNDDVYDVKVDGGFPHAESPPPCTGALCWGQASSPPADGSIGSIDSTEPTGHGTKDHQRPKKKKRRKGHCTVHKCKRHARNHKNSARNHKNSQRGRRAGVRSSSRNGR